jgi:hypothetical protein
MDFIVEVKFMFSFCWAKAQFIFYFFIPELKLRAIHQGNSSGQFIRAFIRAFIRHSFIPELKLTGNSFKQFIMKLLIELPPDLSGGKIMI